jgi:hypothetical protein
MRCDAKCQEAKSYHAEPDCNRLCGGCPRRRGGGL